MQMESISLSSLYIPFIFNKNMNMILESASTSNWLTRACKHMKLIKVDEANSGPLHRHEPRVMTMKLWEPKRSVQRPSQDTYGNMPSIVVWSHMWLGPQPKAISVNLYSYGVLTHDKIWKKSTIVRFRSVMVSRFYVRPTSKKWFWKIIRVTMKHDPFDAM